MVTTTEGLPEAVSATTPAAAAQPTDTQAAPISAAPATEAKPAVDDNDEDSDFDELDELLDDFSKPKPEPVPAQPAPAPAPAPAQDSSTGAVPPDFDEDAFLKQLEADMANMMGGGAPGAPNAQAADPNVQSTVDQGAEMFAKQLEESGVPPGDFLKQLLADVMAEQGGAGESGAASGASNPKPQSSAPDTSSEQPADNFNDAIKRTMGRMKESGDKATAAASNEDDLSDDMIAQLLKAVEAGADGAGEDGDLSKMFMGLMEQLSNKEMLYEPMKELDVKFGPWLEKNKSGGSVPIDDLERFQKQAQIVKQIVTKFEERSYSDDDSKCREYIWERMQEMQAAGSPPEELVSNPLMGDLGGAAAAAAGAGMPECPQQ